MSNYEAKNWHPTNVEVEENRGQNGGDMKFEYLPERDEVDHYQIGKGG